MFVEVRKGKEMDYYRGQKCKERNEPVPIFAFGHYIPVSEGGAEFSKKVNGFHQYGYYFDYFLERLINFYNKRVKGDIVFDIICVCPSHEKSRINENMVHLATAFSEKTDVPYKQILIRVRETKSQHEMKTDEQRKENVRGSFSLSENLNNKNIMILDNTSITTETSQEIYRVMKESGANMCLFISLGLGAKATECDFDINPAYSGKVSKIIKEWHWPKVPVEEREAYKKEKGKDL